MNVEILGVYKLEKELEKLAKKVPKETKQGLIDAGFAMQGVASRLSRVDTGRMRASISVNWTGSGLDKARVNAPAKSTDGVSEPQEKNFVVVVGSGVNYAIYNEFGTRKMAAKPFLRPAFASIIPKLADFIRKRLNRG